MTLFRNTSAWHASRLNCLKQAARKSSPMRKGGTAPLSWAKWGFDAATAPCCRPNTEPAEPFTIPPSFTVSSCVLVYILSLCHFSLVVELLLRVQLLCDTLLRLNRRCRFVILQAFTRRRKTWRAAICANTANTYPNQSGRNLLS